MKRNKLKNKTTKYKRTSKKSGVTPEFLRWVDQFIEEHDDILRELAKR